MLWSPHPRPSPDGRRAGARQTVRRPATDDSPWHRAIRKRMIVIEAIRRPADPPSHVKGLTGASGNGAAYVGPASGMVPRFQRDDRARLPAPRRYALGRAW